MHMILRTFWIFIKKYLTPKNPAGFNEVTEYTMTVLPTDLDLLWHVNNGMYFSYMDFGRYNMIFRTGVWDLCLKKGWYSVVAGETIRFKKFLRLWDKFTLQTKIVGHDDKYFFILQKFICRGDLMATGLVKARFLSKKGGTVSTAEVLKEFDDKFENQAGSLGDEWFALESKYLA